MDPVSITVGLGWTIAGAICILLAIPLVRGQIGRNSFYGVRVRQAFESDEAWQAINRYGGKQMIGWSIPLVVIGLVSFFLPLQSNDALTIVLGFAPMIFILIPVFNTWRFAQRREQKA